MLLLLARLLKQMSNQLKGIASCSANKTFTTFSFYAFFRLPNNTLLKVQSITKSLDVLRYLDGGETKFPSVKQELLSVGCSVEVIDKDGTKTTQPSQESYGHPLILFMLAQLLLGKFQTQVFLKRFLV